MNEILFIGAVVIDLLFSSSALQFGRIGLTLAMSVNLILVSTFAPKLIVTFGLLSNVGNIFYGSLLLAINLILEKYGRRAGRQAIWVAFASNIFFIVMGQFALRFLGDTQSSTANDAVSVLFSNVPRIALASIVAYLLVQYANMWFYLWLKEKTNGKHLWARYMGSVVLAQLFDSLIFFTIAFYGTITTTALAETLFFGFALKSFIGIVSTPLMYLGRTAALDEHDSHVD